MIHGKSFFVPLHLLAISKLQMMSITNLDLMAFFQKIIFLE